MPRPNGGVRLPTDMPPGPRRVLQRMMQGLHTSGSAGQVAVSLYAVPWAPTSSSVFPNAAGSVAAAKIDTSGILPVRAAGGSGNVMRPAYGVAINTYSPVSHRTPPRLRDGIPPRVIPAGGVAVPTQRARNYAPGYVTAWPQSAPRWPTLSEAPGARRG